MQKSLSSYGLSSEQLGGLSRSRSALRDNRGRFVSNSWLQCGVLPDVWLFECPVDKRLDTYCLRGVLSMKFYSGTLIVPV